ncbi:integrase arm-type DNA-binding domain-containing protein [Sphingomonadaceae bacterium G21617-S1]|nr:integrase arm-type DNA-binding domain-containing protein [Sphingomonadaceae bacterium G21617-S1]
MLTAAKIRAAEPRDRAYQIADGRGMYLHVSPAGTKSFRMSFRFAGRAQTLVFGRADQISLNQARELLDNARRQLRDGVNPAGRRRRSVPAEPALESNFEAVARAWHARQLPHWSAEHAGDVLDSLRRHVFPPIGAIAVDQVTLNHVLELLRAIEATGAIAEARRVRQRISAVFKVAIAEGRASFNPAAAVTDALRPVPEPMPKAAVIDIDQAREVLTLTSTASADPLEQLASRFLALTATRWAAVRGARWAEIAGVDWSGERPDRAPAWVIPPARMKLSVARKGMDRYAHIVPLSRQAVELLRAAWSLSGTDEEREVTGVGPLIFARGRAAAPIGVNALSSLYRRAGLQGRHVPHGWRAAFSTIMNDRRPRDRLEIDACLAHLPKDKVEAAYNRSVQLDLRRELLQEWADQLLPA